MNEFFSADIVNNIAVCVVIALAASSVSLTMTQTEIFAPWRNLMRRVHPQVGHLFQCFYCLSHWWVIAATVLLQPRLVHSGYGLVDWFIATFATITVTSWISGLSFKAFLMAMAKGKQEIELKALLAKSNDSA
ncbi:hypothetical protein [Idiomarina xiamenensis]|uniref:DUF1360 domain-containing protein n=1 Tax=Idiomarina xiamenensis 10-D-4 TaxID=740709 RepID=K2KSL7_9GAMM|nr:hypothetical protein [Idiomarina xiamenensis]EKE85424.1 hypothetical protein A10D4_03730 [Idiomarina xiamenensis 10-D-4]